MTNHELVHSILQKLQRVEGFMLGIKIFSLCGKHDNQGIGKNLYDLISDISIAQEQIVELYQNDNGGAE